MLRVYPNSVLGVLLSISGLELALVATDQKERTPATIMFATTGGILAFGSTATGFAIGWALALLIEWTKRNHTERHI